MGRLTDAKLRVLLRAGTPIAGRSDGDGLTFTVSPSQMRKPHRERSASWVLRYRFAGKPRELTLGNYPDMTIEQARVHARLERVRIDRGVDVAAYKRRTRLEATRAKTFRQIAEDYLKRAAKELAERSQREVRRYLEKDLLPRLGSITADAVQPKDVIGTIERIAERSDAVARHA